MTTPTRAKQFNHKHNGNSKNSLTYNKICEMRSSKLAFKLKLSIGLIILMNLQSKGQFHSVYEARVTTFKVQTDSLTHAEVVISLQNHGNDTLKYLTWSCAPNYIFRTNSKFIKISLDSPGCSLELPHLLVLAPCKSKSTTLFLTVKDVKRLPFSFKIGIMIIKNEGINGYNFSFGKKYQYKEIWSNELTWQ
jgi:hypothetical protein